MGSLSPYVCSMKITHARKAVKRRCNEDDAEAHAIDDFIPHKKKTRQHAVCKNF